MSWRNTLLIGLVGTILMSQGRVHAYCLGDNYWPGNVPVWIVTAGTNSVANLGLPIATTLRYAKAAIQEWNEASGFSRRVYFAGEVSNIDHGNAGVTIFATICGSTACGPQYYGCTVGSHIYLYPTGCPQNPVTWGVIPPVEPDVQGVVAHELGHALGLAHSNDVCPTSQGGTTIGVMRSWPDTAAVRGAWRYARRDDIEGLRSLYGKECRWIIYRESTVPTASSWSAENAYPVSVTTPITATDPASSQDNFQGVAYADGCNRVTQLTGWWDGWWGPTVVDPSGAGYVWSTPRIAYSPNRLIVAWLANEPTTDYNMTIRWAIRPIGTTQFSYFNGPSPVRHKTLGLAYDPWDQVFQLSYLDTDSIGHVITINPSTGMMIANVSTALVFHEFGGSAAEPYDWSLTAHSSTGLNGPCLGWVVGRTYLGTWQYDSEYTNCYYSYSSHELTRDGSLNYGGYVGSFTQGDAYAWVYHKANRYSSSGPDNFAAMDTAYWPIGVGAIARNTTEVKYRSYYARNPGPSWQCPSCP